MDSGRQHTGKEGRDCVLRKECVGLNIFPINNSNDDDTFLYIAAYIRVCLFALLYRKVHFYQT